MMPMVVQTMDKPKRKKRAIAYKPFKPVVIMLHEKHSYYS